MANEDEAAHATATAVTSEASSVSSVDAPSTSPVTPPSHARAATPRTTTATAAATSSGHAPSTTQIAVAKATATSGRSTLRSVMAWPSPPSGRAYGSAEAAERRDGANGRADAGADDGKECAAAGDVGSVEHDPAPDRDAREEGDRAGERPSGLHR